jgi:hypothetical protein
MFETRLIQKIFNKEGFKRALNSKKFLCHIVVIVTLVFLILVFSLFLKSNSSQVICKQSECLTKAHLFPVGVIVNKSQSIDLLLKFRENRDVSSYFEYESSERSSIDISRNQSGNLRIQIPMLGSQDNKFSVEAPYPTATQALRIEVKNSRELSMTFDGRIVYSHRYFLPTFFINPNMLFNFENSNLDNDLDYVIQEITIYNEVPNRHLGVIGLLMSSFILLSFVFLIVLRRFFPREVTHLSDKIPVKTIAGFWALSLILWLLGQADFTGSTNPSPFGPIAPAFSDIFQIFQAGQFDFPYDFGAVNYPPLSVALIRFLEPLSLGFAAIFISAISYGIFLWMSDGIKSNRSLNGRLGHLLLFAAPYPIVFALIRGNLDLFAAVLVGLSFIAYNKNRFYISTFFLAIAVALKIWPIVFLLLLVREKRWSLILVCTFVGVTITSFSYSVLGYAGLNQQFKLLTELPDITNGAVGSSTFSYSFSIGAVFFVSYLFAISVSHLTPSDVDIVNSFDFIQSKMYFTITGIFLFLLLLLIFRSRRQESIFLYCAALALLLPNVSYTYRASILIICVIIRIELTGHFYRINDLQSRGVLQKDWRAILLRLCETLSWICILSPTTFYYAKDSLLSISSLIQPLSLIFIVLIEVFYQSKDKKDSIKSKPISIL